MWSVMAKCEAKNNGKVEKFERKIADFDYPYHAQDFIDKCLPKRETGTFYIVANKEAKNAHYASQRNIIKKGD